MSEFKREHRYFVFKVKNLTQEQRQRLYDFEMELGPYNSVGECVVVESDWPNYQDTWSDIQAVTEKRYISRGHLQADCAEWRARAIKAEAGRDALAAQVVNFHQKLDKTLDLILRADIDWYLDGYDDTWITEALAEHAKGVPDAQQCLRDVQADAIEKAVGALSVTIFDKKAFYEYATKVRQGGAE